MDRQGDFYFPPKNICLGVIIRHITNNLPPKSITMYFVPELATANLAPSDPWILLVGISWQYREAASGSSAIDN